MKLAIGLPWYQPDDATFPLNMDVMVYFGELMERSVWRKIIGKDHFDELWTDGALPSLGRMHAEDEYIDPTLEDWDRLGELEVLLINFSKFSLVGKAREHIVELAQTWDADFLLWWDADMRYQHSSFIRLFHHNKPVVGALAFTARFPYQPAIYRIYERPYAGGGTVLEGSDIVFDYPRDQLVGSADIGGELAMGGAYVLYNMNVFKEILQPWFSSTGCGEDWFFCHRCKEFGVERFIDTSVKTQHRGHEPNWVDEQMYWNAREVNREVYEQHYGSKFRSVKDGKFTLTELNGQRCDTQVEGALQEETLS